MERGEMMDSRAAVYVSVFVFMVSAKLSAPNVKDEEERR